MLKIYKDNNSLALRRGCEVVVLLPFLIFIQSFNSCCYLFSRIAATHWFVFLLTQKCDNLLSVNVNRGQHAGHKLTPMHL